MQRDVKSNLYLDKPAAARKTGSSCVITGIPVNIYKQVTIFYNASVIKVMQASYVIVSNTTVSINCIRSRHGAGKEF